jgi:hypothetical protein
MAASDDNTFTYTFTDTLAWRLGTTSIEYIEYIEYKQRH